MDEFANQRHIKRKKYWVCGREERQGQEKKVLHKSI